MKKNAHLLQQIVEEINEKGWNIYKSDRGNFEQTVQHDLAKSLEYGKYILLPWADDPNNFTQVLNALERLAQKHNRNMENINISIQNQKIPMTGFTVMENIIEIHSPQGNYVSYEEFLQALPTLVEGKA